MNQQDLLIGKMFSKTVSKVTADMTPEGEKVTAQQQGLRQTVCQVLFRHGVEERDKCYDSILQQVIEWVEKRRNEFGEENDWYEKNKILNSLLSQLKGELS